MKAFCVHERNDNKIFLCNLKYLNFSCHQSSPPDEVVDISALRLGWAWKTNGRTFFLGVVLLVSWFRTHLVYFCSVVCYFHCFVVYGLVYSSYMYRRHRSSAFFPLGSGLFGPQPDVLTEPSHIPMSKWRWRRYKNSGNTLIGSGIEKPHCVWSAKKTTLLKEDGIQKLKNGRKCWLKRQTMTFKCG